MKHNCSCWCWFWCIISIIIDTSNLHPTRQKKKCEFNLSILQPEKNFICQPVSISIGQRIQHYNSCVCVSLTFNDAFKNEYFPIPSPSICYHTRVYEYKQKTMISVRQSILMLTPASVELDLRSMFVFIFIISLAYF